MADQFQTVTLPDGQVLRFPAGMSRAEMAQAIDSRLGVTRQAPQPPMTAGDVAEDIGKSAWSGIARGVESMVKAPSYVSQGISALMERPMAALGLQRITPEERAQMPEYSRVLSDRDVTSKAFEALTGGGIRYEPKTRAGRIAGAGGEALPFGMLGGSRAAVVEGLLPGAASEAAGQLVEGSAIEMPVRLATALFTPAAIEGGRRMLATGGLDVPAPASPQRMQQMARAEAQGFPLTVGQAADDPIIMAREAATAMGRDMNEKQLEAFTSAALRAAGINAKRATPAVLDDAYRSLGAVFDDVAKQSNIPITTQLADDFNSEIYNYVNTLSAARVPKLIDDLSDEFLALQGSGRRITGKEYQSITTKLRDLRKSGDYTLSQLASRLDNVIQDALGESLQAQGKSGVFAKWADARRKYRNLDTIATAASRQTPEAMEGLIRPTSIYGAEKAKMGKTAVARGMSDLAELARDASAIRALPQSGTAPRSVAAGMAAGAASAVPAVGGIGLATGGDLAQTVAGGALAAGLGGLGAARSRYMNELIGSPRGQDFLRQYLMGQGRPLMSPLPVGGLLSQIEQD